MGCRKVIGWTATSDRYGGRGEAWTVIRMWRDVETKMISMGDGVVLRIRVVVWVVCWVQIEMVVVDMGRRLWHGEMEGFVVELGCEYTSSVMYVELIVVIPDFIGWRCQAGISDDGQFGKESETVMTYYCPRAAAGTVPRRWESGGRSHPRWTGDRPRR